MWKGISPVIVLVLLLVSPLTFELIRPKLFIFELVVPWLFLAWILKGKILPLTDLPKPLIISMLLFFLLPVPLYLINPYKEASFEVLLLWNLSFAFLLIGYEGSIYRKCHRALLFSSLVVLLYGVCQSLGFDFLRTGGEFLEKGRVTSTLANPNDLALCVNFLFFSALYHLIEERRYPYMLIALTSLIVLFLSKSISGILSLVIGIICLLGFKVSKFQVRYILSFILLASIWAFILSGLHLRPESFFYRFSIWNSTIDLIKEKPILGWGFASFKYIFPRYRDPGIFILLKDHQIEITHPENYYLHLLSEGGIIFLSSFILMNILVAFYALRSKSGLSRYLAIALITMLFQNILSETLSSFVPFFLYVLTLMFILSETFPPATDRDMPRIIIYPILALGFPLSLLLSFTSFNLLLSDFYLRKAIHLSGSKELDKAEVFYKEALKRNYCNPLTHYLLGNLYLQRGRDGDELRALMCYGKVEALAGNFLQVYLFKGLAYLKMGDGEKMRLYFKKAFINDPPLFYQMNRVFKELRGR